ncbi:MAG: hypothetical protein EOO09_18065 [Chitinophagaceae bacterium]|nr:MAG: hypothetical protein EOO09_18065 [Chitinophagaceae bacterium]
MEDNYRNDDFEQFVRGQADQHRMFPSEKVWNAVDSALHPRRRWYGFGLAFLLLLTGGAVTWVMNSYPVTSTAVFNGQFSPDAAITTEEAEPLDINDLNPFRENSPVKHINHFSEPVPGPEVGLSAQESLRYTMQENFTAEGSGPVTTDAERSSHLRIVHSAVRNSGLLQVIAEPGISVDVPALAAVTEPDAAPRVTKNPVAVKQADGLPTIESVVNSFRAPAKKLTWQFFVTPTISNRRLSNNTASLAPFGPMAPGNLPFATQTDVNNAVTHKPDVGLQLGFTAGYPISRDVRIIGGFQFNVNRYDIKAFLNNGELARIELSGNNSTVSTWTSYRAQGISRLDWLKNVYLSVSTPIGAEVIVYRNKKATNAFGIAGTIQPTYVIQNKAYLVSTDYKNYAQVPWLVRHTNVSTGFEAFVQHNKGKTHWQVGPQARYQILSSFNKKYPIRENLYDFGVKFAVTLNP